MVGLAFFLLFIGFAAGLISGIVLMQRVWESN
jgi:hypothetical protein